LLNHKFFDRKQIGIGSFLKKRGKFCKAVEVLGGAELPVADYPNLIQCVHLLAIHEHHSP